MSFAVQPSGPQPPPSGPIGPHPRSIEAGRGDPAAPDLSAAVSLPATPADPDRWLDWRWQLRHSLQGPELARHFGADAQTAQWLEAGGGFQSGVTPYFASLCDRGDPACPLRRQVMPDPAERAFADFEHADPLGEDPHRVAPGLIHKYPDRVLLLITDTCAGYCRYCTRSRWVATGAGAGRRDHIDAAVAWIAEHREIADVLISGGDPLLWPTGRLEDLLDRLCAIAHLRLVRIGSRVPIFLPMRVDADLARALRPRRVPVWLNVHINHHRELSPLARERLALLADAGVPLGGQSVLLRGVNDDVATLRETFYAMLSARVRPYYLFHCDPVRGTAHLRTSVDRGLALMQGLIGHVSGMALPRYCIDLQGGGKVPLWPTGVERIDAERLRVRGYDGRLWTYPNR